MLRHLLLGAVLLSASLFACTTSTDLGEPCTPVKALSDGGVTDVLVGDLSSGQDFISFGATECSDLVCVVDQTSASQQLSVAQRDAGISLGSPAVGYCSTACVQGNDSALVMACRELVLDPALIAEICQTPAKCEQYFGSNRSSFFCARGSAPDGGT
jgi:hypothetical protein